MTQDACGVMQKCGHYHHQPSDLFVVQCVYYTTNGGAAFH